MHDEWRVEVRLQWLTCALMALAGFAVEAAFVRSDADWLQAIVVVMTLTALALLGNAIHRRRSVPGRLVAPLTVALAVVVALPFLPLPLSFDFCSGRPFEARALAAFRNLGFVLAAFAARGLFVRLTGVVSLFLVLFAACLSLDNNIRPILAAYAALASFWLMLVHWDTLRQQAPRGMLAFPIAALVLSLVVAGSVAAVSAWTKQAGLPILFELSPASGGTSVHDLYARGGLGDGEDQVAGDKAKTAGFVDSELYIEDTAPSLYDLVTDMYGDVRKRKDFQRMISLRAEQIVPLSERPAVNLRPSRDFSIIRKRPDPSRLPPSLQTKALMFVVGPVPAHFRLTAYDEFHGATLVEAPWEPAPFSFINPDDGDWFTRSYTGRRCCPEQARYQLKFGNLRCDTLPTPPHLDGFRLGKVKQAGMFGWTQPEIVRLIDARIPPGETLTARCGIFDRRLVTGRDCARQLRSSMATQTDSEIAALAQTWTSAAPPGMPQIQAIEQRLRSEYQLDRIATAPADCVDPVAHFLFVSKRGPDYVFASAAALMLRSLGYPVRVVHGLYADPAKLDTRRHFTPVMVDDFHFWTEVQLHNGVWLIVEPSPGYAVLQPTPNWLERLAAVGSQVLQWLADHAVLVTAGGVLLLFLWRSRHAIGDLLATAVWYVLRGRQRRCVQATLRLLAFRSWCAGHSRPDNVTLERWLSELAAISGPAAVGMVERFCQLADWTCYAPCGTPAPTEVEPVCRGAVQVLKLRRSTQRRARTPIIRPGTLTLSAAGNHA